MTVFLTGDNFQRKLTAKDANRMLKAAQEQEAGAGNLTTRDIIDAWQNQQVMVRWDGPLRADAYSVIGIGNALEPYTSGTLPVRDRQQLNIFRGQLLRIKKHWFRHGVLQRHAWPGELVPAAVYGLTFAQMAGSAYDNATGPFQGSRVILRDVAYNGTDDRMGMFEYQTSVSTSFGHAKLMRATNQQLYERHRSLVQLHERNTVWGALLTNRVSTTEFDGHITIYGATLGAIKIWDVFSLMPSTTDIPTGACNIGVGIELTQNCQNSTAEALPDITGYIICVNRSTTLTGVEMSVPPI